MADVQNPDPLTTTADNGPQATGDACRCLRSKEMYLHVDQLDWKTEGSHSGIYWCLHTQNGVGRDGQVAEPASCQAGRSCYQAP
ncbi:MAG TPA: hypothetical protein VGW33_12325 [Terriglobia bacterium]|nr:hypothetical protein [Terriglobia bacterium]